MTYQHVVCLSPRPRAAGSPCPEKAPLPDVITDVPIPAVVATAEGEAVIEVSFILAFFSFLSGPGGSRWTVRD